MVAPAYTGFEPHYLEDRLGLLRFLDYFRIGDIQLSAVNPQHVRSAIEELRQPNRNASPYRLIEIMDVLFDLYSERVIFSSGEEQMRHFKSLGYVTDFLYELSNTAL